MTSDFTGHPFGKRFDLAIAAIDAANADDPRTEEQGGESVATEVLYSRRMTAWVLRLNPDACEALQLAARSQHIRRWEIPRSMYPMDRAGYHRWRTGLYGFHAECAAEILRDSGYDDAMIETVRDLLKKKNLRRDRDAQTLEDAAALVFLEHHFAEFASRPDLDDDKLVGIVGKTWAKMSERGHAAALSLSLPGRPAEIIAKALA